MITALPSATKALIVNGYRTFGAKAIEPLLKDIAKDFKKEELAELITIVQKIHDEKP